MVDWIDGWSPRWILLVQWFQGEIDMLIFGLATPWIVLLSPWRIPSLVRNLCSDVRGHCYYYCFYLFLLLFTAAAIAVLTSCAAL